MSKDDMNQQPAYDPNRPETLRLPNPMFVPGRRPDKYPTTGINQTIRADILHEAMRVTSGDREDNYGDCEPNFTKIAALWSAHLAARYGVSVDLLGEDVAYMMADLKRVRAFAPGYHADNYVDGSCYVAIAGELRKRRTPAKPV